MKNWIIGLMMFFVGISAHASTFEVEVEHFSSVKLMGNYKVVLQAGDADKVVIKNNDDNLYDSKINCEVVNGELVIKIKGDTYKERMMEILITYTEMKSITAKKGCEIKVKNTLVGDEFEFLSESGGKIDANVDCKKVKATISAGGSMDLEGETDKAVYKVGAGGTIGAIDLIATTVIATVTAGGEVICHVVDDFTVNITSGGVVSYRGEPEVFEQKITLGGKINKMK